MRQVERLLPLAKAISQAAWKKITSEDHRESQKVQEACPEALIQLLGSSQKGTDNFSAELFLPSAPSHIPLPCTPHSKHHQKAQLQITKPGERILSAVCIAGQQTLYRRERPSFPQFKYQGKLTCVSSSKAIHWLRVKVGYRRKERQTAILTYFPGSRSH